MTGGWRDTAVFVGIGLRGMRSRLLLTLGSVLLVMIAVAAAVVGPMYQSASAASYLVSTLRSTPDFLSGVTTDFAPSAPTTAVQAQSLARRAEARADLSAFLPAEPSLWSHPRPVTTGGFAEQHAQATLAWLPDCRQLLVRGRCPTRPGETALLAFDVRHTSTRIGAAVGVAGLPAPLRVVGIYRARDVPGRFQGSTRLESVLPHVQGDFNTPYFPAPFLVTGDEVATLPAKDWFVRLDRRLDVTPSTTLADAREAAGQVVGLHGAVHAQQATGHLGIEVGNELRSVVRQAATRQRAGQQTVTPAVVSLILVALVLLARLFAAGLDLRRPELALAALRGTGRRRVWALALLEPLLQLALATPAGLALGYAAAVALSRRWLVPDLPVSFGPASAIFASVVVLAVVGVAALAVHAALREPLSGMLGAVRRPGRAGRWGQLLRLGAVAATLATLGVTVSDRLSRPTAVHLVLPVLLGMTAGLVATGAATVLARSQLRSTGRRPGLVRFVAVRAISRRREGTWVILPLSAALSVAVFAAGVFSAAAGWRASEAATEVGGDLSYRVSMPLTEALALTHRLDPAGRWLMAVAAEPEAHWRKVLVDAPRLPRVADWPSSWTPGMSVADVSRELAPGGPPVTLRGRRLSLTVDNQVRGSTDSLLLTVAAVTARGRQVSILVGAFPRGTSTRSAAMPCARTCRVTALSIGGPGPFDARMHGWVSFGAARAGGTPVPRLAEVGWRDGDTDVALYGPDAVTGTSVADGRATVRLDSRGQSALAQLVPVNHPAALPVLWGRTAEPDVVSRAGDLVTLATAQSKVTVRRVATTESTPYFGPSAILADATLYTDEVYGMDDGTEVFVVARNDTPAAITTALADRGISSPTHLTTVRHTLDDDAYALALNLYAVVTGIVLLLALAGLAVNMALQIPARRRDTASLRVVGVRRRTIMAAVTAELTVVLGLVTVAGILAGALGQYVVVRTLTLGYSDSLSTPRVLPAVDLAEVTGMTVLTFTVLAVIAALIGSATVRRARTDVLREDVT